MAALLGQKHLPGSGEADFVLAREFDQFGVFQTNHLLISLDSVPAEQPVRDNLDREMQSVPQHVQDHQTFIIYRKSLSLKR